MRRGEERGERRGEGVDDAPLFSSLSTTDMDMSICLGSGIGIVT